MTEQPVSKEQKRARNREVLTAAAQIVLLEKGYARTSLREIAHQAQVPLGTLHYYFDDKAELMISAFRMHQQDFIESIAGLAKGEGSLREKCHRIAANWSESLQRDGSAYRIWYDLRNQSLFDPELRPVVEEMEDLQLAAMVDLLGQGQSLDPRILLKMRDYYLPVLGGLFHRYMQRIAYQGRSDPAEQERAFADVFDQLLAELDGPSAR